MTIEETESQQAAVAALEPGLALLAAKQWELEAELKEKEKQGNRLMEQIEKLIRNEEKMERQMEQQKRESKEREEKLERQHQELISLLKQPRP